MKFVLWFLILLHFHINHFRSSIHFDVPSIQRRLGLRPKVCDTNSLCSPLTVCLATIFAEQWWQTQSLPFQKFSDFWNFLNFSFGSALEGMRSKHFVNRDYVSSPHLNHRLIQEFSFKISRLKAEEVKLQVTCSSSQLKILCRLWV